MKLIQITDPFVTLNSEPYNDTKLLQGKTYLLSKMHSQGIADLELGRIVAGADRLSYLPESELRSHDTPLYALFLFDGGYGDAVSLLVFLKALEHTYNIRCNIACKHKIWRDILKPLGFSGDRYPIPVELSVIISHDYIQPRADIYFKDKPNKWELCIVEELAIAYRLDIEKINLHYSIPDDTQKEYTLPESRKIRIGLNFDSKGSIRSYPKDLQPVLIRHLLDAGFEIYIFGTQIPNLSEFIDCSMVHDYCGKTSVPELASMIRQMDLIICMDSFIAHLSNILGKKTLILLSTTRKGVFNWHKNVICLESKINCTPCGEVANSCPKGDDHCAAFFHKSITPEVITFTIINECAMFFNHLIQSSVD